MKKYIAYFLVVLLFLVSFISFIQYFIYHDPTLLMVTNIALFIFCVNLIFTMKPYVDIAIKNENKN